MTILIEKDLRVSDLLNMSYALWEKHKHSWSPMEPEYGRNFILFMIEEIGETIAIIKKKGEKKLKMQYRNLIKQVELNNNGVC